MALGMALTAVPDGLAEADRPLRASATADDVEAAALSSSPAEAEASAPLISSRSKMRPSDPPDGVSGASGTATAAAAAAAPEAGSERCAWIGGTVVSPEAADDAFAMARPVDLAIDPPRLAASAAEADADEPAPVPIPIPVGM
jgi:hypothetical protein